jgi:hypothetical protein
MVYLFSPFSFERPRVRDEQRLGDEQCPGWLCGLCLCALLRWSPAAGSEQLRVVLASAKRPRAARETDLSWLELSRTRRRDVLGEFSRMLSGPPGSVCGPHAIPEALNASVRAPRLLARNRAALPIGPAAASEAKGLRRRSDGAVPGRDRWHGSSVFSSPPPSRVLRMGQPYARQAQPVPHRAREIAPDGRGFRRRRADDASRQ